MWFSWEEVRLVFGKTNLHRENSYHHFKQLTDGAPSQILCVLSFQPTGSSVLTSQQTYQGGTREMVLVSVFFLSLSLAWTSALVPCCKLGVALLMLLRVGILELKVIFERF